MAGERGPGRQPPVASSPRAFRAFTAPPIFESKASETHTVRLAWESEASDSAATKASSRSVVCRVSDSMVGINSQWLPILASKELHGLCTEKLAADVYDRSFLEGFVHGYDPSGRGRAAGCCPGAAWRKSPRSPQLNCAGAAPTSAKRRFELEHRSELPAAAGERGACEKPQRLATPSAPSRTSKNRRARTLERGLDATQTVRQREACESLRMLVFGRVGNEDWMIQDRSQIFEQQRGTEAEMDTFVEQWLLLDSDDNGTIEFIEFLDFFTKKKADRLLGMRCVRYLIGRTGNHSVGREELTRLLWLGATDEDVQAMEALFDLKKLQHASVEPPPLLPKRRRRELLENFRDLDSEGKGLVPYTELVLSGLADEEMMKELRAKYDKDGNGTLDFEEFLEMLCPYGFRAHEKVKMAITKDGQAVRYASRMCGEHHFAGWFTDADYWALKSKYRFND